MCGDTDEPEILGPHCPRARNRKAGAGQTAAAEGRSVPIHLDKGPVMSRIAADLRSLRTHVLEHKAQLSLSLRVTVAAVLSLVVSQLMHLPLPLWAVLTSAILTQVSFGRSLKATLDYLAGTVGGAIYAGAVAAFLPHTDEIALVAVLAIAVAPLALLGAINPSFSVSTFTGVLVVLMPGITHAGPIESAFYRVIEVAVGSIIALAVSIVVLPTHAYSLAVAAVARTLDLMARSCPELFAGYVQARNPVATERIHESIGNAIVQLSTVAAEARHERIGFIHPEPELGPLLRVLLRLRHDLIMIGRAAAVPLPQSLQERLGPLLGRLASAAADYLRQSGEALAARSPSPVTGEVEAALDCCADAFAGIRRERLTVGLSVDDVERIFTLGFALEQMRSNFHDLERCVAEAARGK